MAGPDEPEIALIERAQARDVQTFGEGDDEGINKIEFSISVLAHQKGGAQIVLRQRVLQAQSSRGKTGDEIGGDFVSRISSQQIDRFSDRRNREDDLVADLLNNAENVSVTLIIFVEMCDGKSGV